MSVIMRNTETNKVYAFVKGADSSILPRISHVRGMTPKSNIVFGRSIEKPISEEELDAATIAEKKRIDVIVENMAKQGLRTLCYAMKEIPDFPEDMDPQDLEPGDIECDLQMLAITAVEDLLQDDVKEVIVDFRKAGISVWMLTGDKGLTA